MTPDEIEQMKADIEAGTPGPWRAGQHGNFRVYGPDGIGEHSGLIAEVLKGKANAYRIARVPDLEAEALRLREALIHINAMDPEYHGIDRFSDDDLRGIVLEMGREARAALSREPDT